VNATEQLQLSLTAALWGREISHDAAIKAANIVAAPEMHKVLVALDLGLRLLDTGYQDMHIVEFKEDGFALLHPIDCRPDMLGCDFHVWLGYEEEQMPPGRYALKWSRHGYGNPVYEKLP
jgi:hypothetical protein